VIGLDTNLLVYAHRKDSPFHAQALACVSALAQGTAPWAIPWPCLHEFLAVVTHPRIYRPASTLTQALSQIDAWLESPALVLLAETPVHWSALRALLEKGQVTGPQAHDARIAALCLQHGVRELWSSDRDFSRFGALKTRNPLVA
jgi:uncharacterized protein